MEVANVLSRASWLQRAALEGNKPFLLRGKHLGLLCETPPDEAQALFRSAAEELGARVSTVRPGLSLASAPQEVKDTSIMLGRLYDAAECKGLDEVLVQRIRQYAGIPIFEGGARKEHAVDRVAELLGDSTCPADNRRFVLQALLLEAIL